jgi:hypothetical protein
VELRFFQSDVRLFKKSEAFLKHLNGKCEAFIKITRLFEDSFRKMEFNKKFEASSKITRLFEDIFNGIETFLK